MLGALRQAAVAGHSAVATAPRLLPVATLRSSAAAFAISRPRAEITRTDKRIYPIPRGFEIDYKNVGFLSQFVSDNTGQILRRDITGLTAKHQRQVARAIKRARAFGLMPYMYKLDQFKSTEQAPYTKRNTAQ